MLDALDTLVDNGLSDGALNAVILVLLDGDAFDDDDDKRCLIALAWHREQGNNTGPADCSVQYGDVIKVGGEEYRVLDDDEREAAYEDYLESCLDDGGVVPGADSPHFDRESWKRDARMDGVGPALAGYDGNENEYHHGLDVWFLYRVT